MSQLLRRLPCKQPDQLRKSVIKLRGILIMGQEIGRGACHVLTITSRKPER